ncbi:MAG TPA: sigma-70 family RNA polymerase sigma factor [bacterium]|nr:sigma-70 family RNA polymerase sigma factor [bacterium]
MARCTSRLSDEELVARCRGGDHAAFTAIVDRYKDRVFWLVKRMVGDMDAEDLTQEAFLRAYRAMPALRTGATLRTWLFRIAHNLCLTELAKRGRRGEHLSIEEEGDERLEPLLAQASKNLEERLDERDFAGRVLDQVQQLPVAYRTALTLYYMDEAKYEEIAEVMGIPLGTVKTYLHRARLRLRQLVIGSGL